MSLNDSNNAGSDNPLPFRANINWVVAGGAVTTIFTYFAPNIPDKVRDAFLYLALIGLIFGVTWYHNFVNHKLNGAAVKALIDHHVAKAKGIVPLIAICLVGCLVFSLSACSPGSYFANPQNDLNLATAGIQTIEALYVSACRTGAVQQICTDEDQAHAARLEQAITSAIAAAQLAVNLYNGVAAPSGANPAPTIDQVEKAIDAVTKAVGDFSAFVNQLEAKKATMLTAKAAKLQISGSGTVTPPAH